MVGKTQIDGDQIVPGSITDLEISTIANIQIGKISINADVLPDTDNTRSLGSAMDTFANLFLKTGLVMQQTGSGLSAITLKAPTSVTSYNLILPSAQGGVSTVLTNDGSGNLSWGAGSGGSGVSSLNKLTGVLAITAGTGIAVTEAAANAVTSYALTAGSQPLGCCAGPDGNIWFCFNDASTIAKVTPAGIITTYPTPTPSATPIGICLGSDGNLWFVENGANNVCRITPFGVITEFPVTTPSASLSVICTGPDGNLWFTEGNANQIGVMNTSGVMINEYPITTPSASPNGICAGPDGNIWFTETGPSNIAQITTSGVITEFPVTTVGAQPYGICVGSDGNLWFCEITANQIGVMNTSGVMINEYAAGNGPVFPCLGPDGNVWFTVSGDNTIAKITPTGVVTAFAGPMPSANLNFICAGPDGNLWFSEQFANYVGNIVPTDAIVVSSSVTSNNSSGPDGAIQFSNGSGGFGGDANLFWDDNGNFSITGAGGGAELALNGDTGTGIQFQTSDATVEYASIGVTGAGGGTMFLVTNVSGSAQNWQFNPDGSLLTPGTIVTPTIQITTTPTSGYVLTSDGSGFGSWQPSAATPAGANTQIQYNNAGAFGANSALTFVSGATAVLGLNNDNGAALFLYESDGVTLQAAFESSPGGLLTIDAAGASISLNPGQAGSGIGSWVFLDSGTFTAPAGGVIVTQNIQITSAPSNGYVLTSDGSGFGSWQPAPVTVPAGSDSQIQFNTSGAFAASADLYFSTVNNALIIGATGPFAGNAAVLAMGSAQGTEIQFFSGVPFTDPEIGEIDGNIDGSISIDLTAGHTFKFSPDGGFVLPSLATEPGSPVPGEVIYQSTANTLEFYNGTAWVPVGGGGSYSPTVQTLTTATSITTFGYYFLDFTGGQFDVTLPDATTFPTGQFIQVEIIAGTGTANINSTQDIDGIGPGNAVITTTPGGNGATSIKLVSDGSNWQIDGSNTNAGNSTTYTNSLTVEGVSYLKNGVIIQSGEVDLQGSGSVTNAFEFSTFGSSLVLNGSSSGDIFAANGNFTVDGSGNTTIAGSLHCGNSFNIFNTDGSVSMGAGNVQIDNSGNLSVNPGIHFTVGGPTGSTPALYTSATSNVGIGTNTPNASAILDVESSTQGFLMPQMADPTVIASPVAGLQVYNTTTNAINVYNGTAWVPVGGGGSTPFVQNVTFADTPVTITQAGYYFVDTTGGEVDFNLPDATSFTGQSIQIQVVTGSNISNITAVGSQTIDTDGTPYTLNPPFTPGISDSILASSSIKIVSDGSNWQIDSTNTFPVGNIVCNGLYTNSPSSMCSGTLSVTSSGATVVGTLDVQAGGSGAIAVDGTVTFGTNLSSSSGKFVVDGTTGNLSTVTSIEWQENDTPLSPSSNTGIIYYDSTLSKFQVSENGGSFTNLVSSIPATPVTHVSANVSISTPGFYVWNAGASTVTVTLPSASSVTGQIFYFNAVQAGPLTGLASPVNIVTGPDGNLWFTEQGVSSICVMTPSGVFLASYATPTPSAAPFAICVGPDNNLWFTEQSGNNVGRCTTSGVITEFPIPTTSSGSAGICVGSDGNLWFCETSANQIGQCTTSGVITEFPVTTPGSVPQYICNGPDNNLWFTEQVANNIGTMNTSGVMIAEYPTAGGSNPITICVGSDNNLWFCEQASGNIGQITTAGVVTEFPTTSGGSVYGIVAGPDSNLWFCEFVANNIGTMNTSGVMVNEFPIPTGSSTALGITVGPDSNLWFCEETGNQIGQITTSGVITEFSFGTGAPTVASVSGETLDGVNITSSPKTISNATLSIISDGSNWFTL